MLVSQTSVVEGTIVHYVAFNHRHLAAIVIGVNPRDPEITGQSVDLVVFTNMPNVVGHKNFGTQFHQDVFESNDKQPGTWHSIERA
jgi:hypothetical protein